MSDGITEGHRGRDLSQQDKEVRTGVEAMALVGRIMAGNEEEIAKILMENGLFLLREAFAYAFGNGVHHGREYQCADIQAMLGMKVQARSSYNHKTDSAAALKMFCQSNELFKKMFPEEKV